jgi:hypothetical protein
MSIPTSRVIFRFGIFYFLWDDPLFNPGEAEEYLSAGTRNPDWLIQARREKQLSTLEMLFAAVTDREDQIAKLNDAVENLKAVLREVRASQLWILARFLPHVRRDVAERIWIDRRINMMDPDFSFQKAIGLE